MALSPAANDSQASPLLVGALPHVPAGLSIRGEWPCAIGPVQYAQWCAEKTDVFWSDFVDRQEQR